MYQPTRLITALGSFRFILLLSCALMILICVEPASAQSGRKVPKRAEPVDPTPSKNEPEPEPAPQPVQPREQLPAIQLLVAGDPSSKLNLPNGFSEYVVKNVVARLRQSNRIEVGLGKELNRKQATDQAKSEQERFVVLIAVESQRTDFNQPSLNDISVDYVVFTPGTGKVKTQGRVYLRPYRPGIGIGGVGVPLPAPGTNPLELPLQQAGVETADRIMSTFNIGIAGQRPF